MKAITILFIIAYIPFINVSEKKLLNELENLYRNNVYKWQISNHYYKMAEYYSYNKLADKAFIMLVRANLTGYYKFSKVYNNKIFLSLRSLRYWKNFKKIGKKPINFSTTGYYFKPGTGFKRRIYTRILKRILKRKNQSLINSLKSYHIVKAFSSGGKNVYEIYYKYHSDMTRFKAYKVNQYSFDKKIIYTRNLITGKSLFYFYYRDNMWIVSFQENMGKIQWELLQ